MLAFTVIDGQITAIDALAGPERMTRLGLGAFIARELGRRAAHAESR